MILFTLILAFLSALVYADLSQFPNCDLASPSLSDKWNQYKSRHGRKYKNSSEEKARSDRFKRRMCEIDYQNSISLEEGSAEFGPNQFSDWHDEEFEALQGGRLETSSIQKRDTEVNAYDQPVPTTVTSKNWCTDGYCSPIKDQKTCGSCWAYSTTAAYESAVAIKLNLKGSSVPVYSPQYILDCNNVTSVRPGSSSCWKGNGCDGGPVSFGYIKEKGHFTLANYPFSSDLNQHNCAKPDSVPGDITLTNWVNAQTETEDQIAANLAAYGPIVALVYAGQAWQNYVSGSLTAAQCGSGQVNHAVVLVGYTATDWIIRNSWGPSWGESGFIRIARGQAACQITGYAYLVPSTFIPNGPTPATTPSSTPKTTPVTTPSATPKTTPSATPKTTPSATPKTTPSATPSATPKTTPSSSTCLASGCLSWPRTVGAITMTCCSNLPIYGVPVSSTGICFTNITQTSSGSSFVYKNCPSTCGTNPPTYTASSSYGGNNKNDNLKIVAIPENTILAINSETGASFTPSDSPLPVYIGAGVVAAVALVVIVVIAVLVKRRANQEEIV